MGQVNICFPFSDTAASRVTCSFLSYIYFLKEMYPLLFSWFLHWHLGICGIWHKWADFEGWMPFTIHVSSEINNANRTLVCMCIQTEIKLISQIISKHQVQMPVVKVWIFLLQQLQSGFFLNSCIEFHSRENCFVAKWLLPWFLLKEGFWREEWVQMCCLFQSCVVSFNAQCF